MNGEIQWPRALYPDSGITVVRRLAINTQGIIRYPVVDHLVKFV